MPFRKFFGRSAEPAKPEPEPPDEADEPVAESDEVGEQEFEEAAPEESASADEIASEWRVRAAAVVPGGSSTGSKQPQALYGALDVGGPAHYLRASGCHVVTVAEETLIDCTMALGSVSLGYADEGVTRAVLSAIATGHVAGLASYLEVEVAERLCELIPCAEQVRFVKSGAEATSAAVRIARASTGRSHVIASGYVGWHDWANSGAGIPASAIADVTRVPFDDADALERAVSTAGSNLAAVILEPVIDREPYPDWLRAARSLCDSAGAVLIFDEMKTGFRLKIGGYQEVCEITPDVATFGKAMANGYPIAAIVGRESVMKAARETWISSTLAGEALSLAAVAHVIERYSGDVDVCARLAEIGGAIRASVVAAIEASGIQGVRVEGLDPMWQIRFEDEAVERDFLSRAVRHGALFKRGAYNYASLAHGEEEVITELERIASGVFVEMVEEGVT